MQVVTSLIAVTFLSACAGGAQGKADAARGGGSSQSAKVGAPAPDWRMPTSAGGTLALASLKGKPIYLNFFATWCPPCNEEAPAVNNLQKKYAARGLTVIGVDELEGPKKAEEFRKKYSLVYPALVDSGVLQGQYAVNGLPVHVFISRDGIVKQIRVGEMNTSDIDAAIRAIL
ncbi:MAG: TlpA family protein disulfide reductase [Vulcanimicrobiaceae bacterium]